MFSKLSKLRFATAGNAIAILIVVFIVVAVVEPLAIQYYGITIARITEIAFVGVGLVFVIILGEIDLSVGANMTVAALVTAVTSENLFVAAVSGIAVGVLIGLVNGALTVFLGIHSFITTLGTMITLSGLALIVSDGAPIALASPAGTVLVRSVLIGQLTVAGLALLIVVVVAAIWLSRFKSGRNLYVVGGSTVAARSAGISITRTRLTSFLLCGAFAGCAGVMSSLQVGSVPPTVNPTVLLMGIASAVLGGGVLTGGRGSALGALAGAAALGLMQSAFEIGGASSALKDICVGLILFVAVLSSVRFPTTWTFHRLGESLGIGTRTSHQSDRNLETVTAGGNND